MVSHKYNNLLDLIKFNSYNFVISIEGYLQCKTWILNVSYSVGNIKFCYLMLSRITVIKAGTGETVEMQNTT